MQSHSSTLKASFQRYVECQFPRVLTQMDRDPDSPTFGCFDRNYWHYKIRDFPSSILQQGAFTLEAIRTGAVASVNSTTTIDCWCIAAVNALGRQVDSQGRVDEYYPFEAGYPPAAFGLYAAARLMFEWQTSAPELSALVDTAPLKRLAQHLAARVEQGATNQQAAGLAGLALAVKVGLAPELRNRVEALAKLIFEAQHPEGWFNEYGGPDFGYLTVTLDALIDYYDATSDRRAITAIDRAVGFLAQMVGADGCLPSTLNSRNTDYVVPYGLVRAAAWNATAAWLVSELFTDIADPTHFFWSTDDRYHCHYIFASIVRSLPHLEAMQPAQVPPMETSTWLEGCGFWIYRPLEQSWTAYVAARKGGLVRIHQQGSQPTVLDHGWRITRGTQIWTTNWWSAEWRVAKQADSIRISGQCQKAKFHTVNPFKHLVLRILAFSLRQAVIPLLKRGMIFRPFSSDGPRFERHVEMSTGGIRLKDHISSYQGAEARPSVRQNLRHVASADSFSREELLPGLSETAPQKLETEVSTVTEWRPRDMANQTVY
ncbi:MAG: hypothetical protein ACFBSF_19435 [Leptolyngbyaceae cyanobacterium]